MSTKMISNNAPILIRSMSLGKFLPKFFRPGGFRA